MSVRTQAGLPRPKPGFRSPLWDGGFGLDSRDKPRKLTGIAAAKTICRTLFFFLRFMFGAGVPKTRKF